MEGRKAGVPCEPSDRNKRVNQTQTILRVPSIAGFLSFSLSVASI